MVGCGLTIADGGTGIVAGWGMTELYFFNGGLLTAIGIDCYLFRSFVKYPSTLNFNLFAFWSIIFENI